MNRSCLLVAGAAMLLLPSLVSAQPPGRGGPGNGREGNGGQGGGPGGRGGPGGSPLEMISKIFDTADANGDGFLTKEELTTAMQAERGGDRRGGNEQRPGGPPRQGGPDGRRGEHGVEHGGEHGEHHGPPPRPGQVLPDFMQEALKLTDDQKSQLSSLQKTVDETLAKVLTAEQQSQLNEPGGFGPPGGRGGPEGGRGRGEGGRDEGGPRGGRPGQDGPANRRPQ